MEFDYLTQGKLFKTAVFFSANGKIPQAIKVNKLNASLSYFIEHDPMKTLGISKRSFIPGLHYLYILWSSGLEQVASIGTFIDVKHRKKPGV